MRRYYILSAILLTLPIIDFAVAAPVLPGKKHQAGVNAVHTSSMTMEKRAKLGEVLDIALDHPESPPLSAPAHGRKNFKRPLSPIPEETSSELDPASPTADMDFLMEPWSPSTSPTKSFTVDGGWRDEDGNEIIRHTPGLKYWVNLEDSSPKRLKLASSGEFGQAQEYQSNLRPSNLGPSNPGLPTEPVVILPSPNLGPSKDLDDVVAQGSPPRSDWTDPELPLDRLSLSDSQPVDPQAAAALYAVKGKAKESRRVPGTARDVERDPEGVAGWQPAERSLDPGE